jgi:hypothetical protein
MESHLVQVVFDAQNFLLELISGLLQLNDLIHPICPVWMGWLVKCIVLFGLQTFSFSLCKSGLIQDLILFKLYKTAGFIHF